MGRHFQSLKLGGQGNDNAGGRELVADIVLHDHPRTLTGLNMTAGRQREKVRLRSVVFSLPITCGSLAMARETTSATPTVAVIDGTGLYRVRMKAEVSL